MEPELFISRIVNSKLCDKRLNLKRQCWTEGLKATEFPEIWKRKTTWSVLERSTVNIDPANLEDCH